MFLFGIVLIFLCVVAESFECVKLFLSTFGRKILEFMAAGLLPAIFVAFCTDIVSTKQQKCYYEKFYDDSIKVLKSMCENLPTELHACIAEIYQKENAPDEEWEKRKTFSEWCHILSIKKDKECIRYMKQEVRCIKVEATKALEKLTAYQAYRNEENIKALENLINGCEAFCRVVDENGKYTGNYECHPNKFIQAIIKVFSTNLEENKYIRIGYLEAFNSDDFCQ